MKDKKELFLNKRIRTGGFYELCIEVCPSIETEPVKSYLKHLWSLSNIEGPYNDKYELINNDYTNYSQEGILVINDYNIPFKTINIREEDPIETGYNWLDISFYSSTIEHVFGSEYRTWEEPFNSPSLLDEFLLHTMKELHRIYPFRLAFIGFEASGQYYLEDFKNNLGTDITTTFFTGSENNKLIAESNKKYIEIVN